MAILDRASFPQVDSGPGIHKPLVVLYLLVEGNIDPKGFVMG
jgi:hypothetical protein